MTLNRFKRGLRIIKSYGFNPIGVSVMICEETYIFNSDDEACAAHELLEGMLNRNYGVDGWWYGKDAFFEASEEYEKEMGYKPEVIWLA